MANKPRILVLGGAEMDMVVESPSFPAANETVTSLEKYDLVPGGKGVNCSVCASRLGADVLLCTRMGADASGLALRKFLQEEGIDLRYAKMDKTAQTGFCTVISNGEEKRRIYFPGANNLIFSDDVEDAFTSYPDALLLQLDINFSVLASSIKHAQDKKVTVFMSTSPSAKNFPLSTLSKTEAFIAGEREAYELTGIRATSADNYLKIAIELYNRLDTKYIVLRLCERGTYVYDGKYCEIVQPFDVPALDSEGADDAFLSAICTEYVRTKDIISASRFANAVYAYVCSKYGGTQIMPTRQEILEFLNTYEQ